MTPKEKHQLCAQHAADFQAVGTQWGIGLMKRSELAALFEERNKLHHVTEDRDRLFSALRMVMDTAPELPVETYQAIVEALKR